MKTPVPTRKTSLPTTKDIEDLVAFLPRLYAPGITPIIGRGSGASQDGTPFLPWPGYADVVEEFFAAASSECWTDSGYVAHDVNRILEREDGLAELGIDEIRSVLTFIVRGERFCDGHWAAMIEAGHVRRVLERLAEIGAKSHAKPGKVQEKEMPNFLSWASSFGEMRKRALLPKKDVANPPWSEKLQQQTRDAFEKLGTLPDGLLRVKHKLLGDATVDVLEFLRDGRVVCTSTDGRTRWEYPDVEALLTNGWARVSTSPRRPQGA